MATAPAPRPPKVGKYAEDDRGNTFLVLAIKDGLARIESVASKTVFTGVPVTELTRCTMIEEVS